MSLGVLVVLFLSFLGKAAAKNAFLGRKASRPRAFGSSRGLWPRGPGRPRCCRAYTKRQAPTWAGDRRVTGGFGFQELIPRNPPVASLLVYNFGGQPLCKRPRRALCFP